MRGWPRERAAPEVDAVGELLRARSCRLQRWEVGEEIARLQVLRLLLLPPVLSHKPERHARLLCLRLALLSALLVLVPQLLAPVFLLPLRLLMLLLKLLLLVLCLS